MATTSESAELSMRVKALEADVADLQRRLTGAIGVVELLIEDVKQLRRLAGLDR